MGRVPVRVAAGTVTTAGTTPVVVLDDGSRLRPLWPTTPVRDGDVVQVLVVDSTSIVIGPLEQTPRPTSGTIYGAPSVGLIPVATTTGTVSARYTGTAPQIGTLVALLWQGTTPVVLPGRLAPISATPVLDPTTELPTPPAPGPPSGTLLVAATGSGTWRTGTWGWAWSTDVQQGAWDGGQDNHGGWWYGHPPRALTGRTVTAVRLRLGARTGIGAHDTPATAHLYRTTDPTRPTGDLTRVAGPTHVALAPDAPAGWITLPTTWGQALIETGGGIAITGSPHLGITGTDPESGQLAIDWTR